MNQYLFKARLGALKKYLKQYADLEFMDAPVDLLEVKVDEASGETYPVNRRTWWRFTEQQDPATGTSTYIYHGVEDALQAVKDEYEKNGPYDGVLGFSQGAAVAALLISRGVVPFKFAILVSGFVPRDPHTTLREKCDVPTLHVLGQTDEILPPQNSRRLIDYFVNPMVIEHEGGHYVPTTPETVAAYKELVSRFVVDS
jgi:predicted esterase